MRSGEGITSTESAQLNSVVELGNGMSLRFKRKSRWNWIKPGSTADHEARHAAVAPWKVKQMTRIPSGNTLGATFFDGDFDPVMAAAPAAFGCDGCGGDHHATIAHGHDWHASQVKARSALAHKSELIFLLGSALEESGTLSRAEVQEIHTIFEYGFEVEIEIVDQTGNITGRMLGYRTKAESILIPAELVTRSYIQPSTTEVAREAA